jgi:hypothetical protein
MHKGASLYSEWHKWKPFAHACISDIFLEFKRVLVWKEMFVISEYTKKIRLYCIDENIMEELVLSFKNWL